MDNYHDVVHQLGEFLQLHGHDFRTAKDLPLRIDTPKSVGFGTKGKYWYKLHSFRPQSGGELIRGSFGKYGSDKAERVAIDWKPIDEAERKRLADQLAARRAEADKVRQAEAESTAQSAVDLWHRGSKFGESPYLDRKGVIGESCRWLTVAMVLYWPGRTPDERDVEIPLPVGTLLVPLLRYDRPLDEALRGLQFIRPDGSKIYSRGFFKPGCAVRLGKVLPGHIVLVCEGYATGLTLRMATNRDLAVYVALDAGNLQHVVALVRELHPESRILICGDDDWRTRDKQTQQLTNPGRTAARAAAKATDHCDFLLPIFTSATRQEKDTDFNDLHARQGLDAVTRQIQSVVLAMRSRYG